jgi:ubiquinone/menaquinone biosynthesis C-methylase UbiE
MKTGKYSCLLSADACKDVYTNPEKMKAYMHGVLLTQFLWKNHFLMLRFYMLEVLTSFVPKECLEIGVGHGFLLSHAINKYPDSHFRVVDISPISINMAKSIIRYQTTYHKEIAFIESDIREFESEKKFDYIIMGEVLEHVEDPMSLLLAVKKLLAPEGRFYMTTCANCPAIDHVYCFDSVEAIVEMINESGFRILKDLALPVDNFPREVWREKRVGVNYAGLLAHE